MTSAQLACSAARPRLVHPPDRPRRGLVEGSGDFMQVKGGGQSRDRTGGCARGALPAARFRRAAFRCRRCGRPAEWVGHPAVHDVGAQPLQQLGAQRDRRHRPVRDVRPYPREDSPVRGPVRAAASGHGERRVDLPHPDGPTTTTSSPSATAQLTPCTTSRAPKDLRTPSRVTVAIFFGLAHHRCSSRYK